MTSLSNITLRVHSLEAEEKFYGGVLGLSFQRSEGVAHIAGKDGVPFLTLLEAPTAPARPTQTAGLFHLAILFPDRKSLAEVLARLASGRYPIDGMSDHGVSEAIYLRDPENNGVELYCDRPRAAWPFKDGKLAMVTLRLDV